METWLLKVALFTWQAADVLMPWLGISAGVSGMAAFSNQQAERMDRAVFWGVILAVSILLGPVAWLGLAPAIEWLFEVEAQRFDLWILAAQGAGALGGFLLMFFYYRSVSPRIDTLKHKITRRSSVERNRRTDVREIEGHLPDPGKIYDARKKIPKLPQKDGVFIGMKEDGKPYMVPYDVWRKSHVQVVGTTGAGKGVVSGVLLAQSIRAGESVIVVDPKDDEWAPHVLRSVCEEAGVPFHLVDLRARVPQLDLLAGVDADDLEEMLIAGFSLDEKGEAADHYRLGDRAAARLAGTCLDTCKTIADLYTAPALQNVEDADGFVKKLGEMACVDAIQAPGGLDLADVMEHGGCVYVIGSMKTSRIKNAQRMALIRILQIAAKRDRMKTLRPCAVFLDEFKYHISRPALESLGAARDKGVHVILAHQSVADLKDCPADLDGDAVVGAVVENCRLRVAYRVQDPETADWLGRMSGTILVDDETRKTSRNAALSESVSGDRTIRQAERYFIDVNMLRNLPDRVAVVYGAGLPTPAHVCPITTEKQPLELYQMPETGIAEKRPSPLEMPAEDEDETAEEAPEETVSSDDAEPAAEEEATAKKPTKPKPTSERQHLSALIDLDDLEDI